MVQFEVVSKDKRCFKTRTKQKEVSYFLEKQVPQRLFLPDDVIQIQVINEGYGAENYCV